jgi:hypothetical protein
VARLLEAALCIVGVLSDLRVLAHKASRARGGQKDVQRWTSKPGRPEGMKGLHF